MIIKGESRIENATNTACRACSNQHLQGNFTIKNHHCPSHPYCPPQRIDYRSADGANNAAEQIVLERNENREKRPASCENGGDLTFAAIDALFAGYKSTRITWLICIIDVAAYPAMVILIEVHRNKSLRTTLRKTQGNECSQMN